MLDWIKTNVFTVVFLVLMVAALVGLPILAGRLNAGVQEEVTARSKKIQELDKLGKTQVEIPQSDGAPPLPQAILINDAFIQRMREVTDLRRADAERVTQLALDHNRAGRDVLAV